MESSEDVLDFWLNRVGPKGWYMVSDATDGEICKRYSHLWVEAQKDGHLGWTTTPRSMLALLIVLDQFPRNMFRGDSRAFASDGAARNMAKKGLSRGFDMRVNEPERQFFYLPLMHSECLEDQDRCVRLMLERMPEHGADNLTHAKAHREIIRRYGRFPHRNDDLGRHSTKREHEYLAGGGYAGVVNALRQAA